MEIGDTKSKSKKRRVGLWASSHAAGLQEAEEKSGHAIAVLKASNNALLTRILAS